MARQGAGYWIDGATGKIAQVTKHEKWLQDPKNLAAFGLEKLGPVIAKFESSDIDSIRIAGMQAGLVRTRNNQGMISIQFYAPRGKVSDYLYNTAEALASVGEYGMNAWICNLMYDDAVTVSWKDFKKNTAGGIPMLIHEDKDKSHIDDVPHDSELLRRVARELQLAGLNPGG